jgi:ABC-type bacteriocin/lantibiotic exporter with double-glycine peptidase domain
MSQKSTSHRSTPQSAFQWAIYLWQQSPKEDRWAFIRAFVISVMAIALIALAPLFFARILDKTSTQSLTDQTLISMVSAFLILRFLGQCMIDIRWITVNPLLYRIVYRYSLELCRMISESKGRLSDRLNRVAEVSHTVAVIEKAHNGLMALAYNVIALILPVLIEIAVIFGVTAVVLGWWAPYVVLLALLGSGLSMLILRGQEAKTLQNALEADNAIFREVGQVIGFSPLIREFKAFPFFQKRLLARISDSLHEHGQHFSVKTRRSLAHTGITALAYTSVLGYVLWNTRHTSLTPGDLFLILAYMDRLIAPLGSLILAKIGVENALVNLRGVGDVLGEISSLKEESIALEEGYWRIKLSYPNWPTEGLYIPKDSRIQVAGLSGSGKTSLLMSIYENISEEKGYYLTEKPLIIEGSVADNLGFNHENSPALSDWLWIWQDVLKRSAPGLNQAADSLSAGEMQLLAFVRVLHTSPHFVFLDEGLSAMDLAMESAVVALMKDKFPDTVIFLVSHRPIASYKPNCTIEIKNGQICSVEEKTESFERLESFKDYAALRA